MIELREWGRTPGLLDRPWLLLGKGPTFASHRDVDLSRFSLLALNHVVRELAVDVAHAIDVDVVAECADAIRENAQWLLMPRYPHVENAPSGRPLEQFYGEIPVLGELDEAGKLVWYNLSTGPSVGDSPVIPAFFFSAEAALRVLAVVGAKRVRSLGVDGGRGYSTAFNDLEKQTLLVNTRVSFDEQFAEIERIVDDYGLDYAPLVAAPPIRVFVGCDESQLVAATVLEHSIRKHASRRVEFTKMIDLPAPVPRDPANRARTGFSFYRFMIPKLAGFEGRALYLDSDMQVFADMSELWEIPFDGATVLCTNQPEPPEQWKDDPSFKPGRHLAVMMLDCSRLRWDIDEIVGGLDEGQYDYTQLMSDLVIVPDDQIAASIPIEWNHLERFEEGKTRLLHYTVVPTQPWKDDENPLRDLWLEDFRDALRSHVLEPELVLRSIKKGYVKRSLANEIRHAPGWEDVRNPAGLVQRVRGRFRLRRALF